MNETYSEEEKLEVLKTARSRGAIGPSAIVPQFVQAIAYNSYDYILDYGSGPRAIHTQSLRDAGFRNSWAYDFLQDPDCKHLFVDETSSDNGNWDIIFASNVLNIQISESMLHRTLNDIWNRMAAYTILVVNYPKSPRKIPLKFDDIVKQLNKGFRRVHVAGSNVCVCSRPIWLSPTFVGDRMKRSLVRMSNVIG